MAELEEIGFSRGEVSAQAPNSFKWRKNIAAICPTRDNMIYLESFYSFMNDRIGKILGMLFYVII